MPSLKEITWSLYGCYKLALRDKDALSFFNFSASGFWSSFAAMVLGLLVTILQKSLEYKIAHTNVGLIQFVALIVSALAVSWIFYLIAVSIISKYMGFSQHIGGFIIVYNWSQLALTGIWVILSILTLGLFGPTALGIIGLLFIGLSYTYLWYILVVTLKVSPMVAVGLSVLEFAISVLIQQTAINAFLA